ncbi:hypothetical protein KMP13_02240 [Epibacterium ulvae]|uniref:hypothetical protein n=1 Tax=Epibacterium ulvae TaxID=1156985 RepID=UPI001BFC9663|nr:hypothetical protein [Epibacterium ulvae]MBT8152733.1 hypothetical protein [Epibacterium ulvae]
MNKVAENLVRCAVSFKMNEGTDCKTVLLRGSTPQHKLEEQARAALYRQYDIAGAQITRIKLEVPENPPPATGAETEAAA